ncbi:MAG: hypothetical protein RLZZ546_1207 [Bacteroidota bacterium]|jgi:outer membrane protein OmpA-like peptidoglycan-associated protein
MRPIVYLFIVILSSAKLIGQEKIFINFKTNEFLLNDEDKSLIADQIKKLNSQKSYTITISGHTDNVGNKKFNFGLSKKRAKMVSNYILSFNLSNINIIENHYGFEKPIENNDSEFGKSKNRRTEISFQENTTKPSSQNINLTGIVQSSKSKFIANTKLVFRNDTGEKSTTTDMNGKYSILLLGETKYEIEVKHQEHFNFLDVITTPKADSKYDITLIPKEEKQIVKINNLTFVNNKAIINDNSKASLVSLLSQMKKETNICFQILGHVNAPHLDAAQYDDYTHNLSVARALNIYDYFVANGIDKNRMSIMGMGHSKMAYPKPLKTEEYMANMRVELSIMKCEEIMELKAKESEVEYNRIRNSTYFK